MKEKIKKLLVAFVVFMMSLGFMSPASALDDSNPFTCVLQWDIPNDTTFTITFAGGEVDVGFTHSGMTENLVEPDSQDASAETPIIVVTNAGNLALDFSCNLTAAKPSWATLLVGSSNLSASAVTFDTTKVEFLDNIAAAASGDMYIWTNITLGTAGNTQRTLHINTSAHP